MSWYFMAFKKYAEFTGRSRRKEYWMFYLFNIFAAIILAVIEVLLFGKESIITGIYILVIFLPSLALIVRRLHDTDHSGWWFFINFIPILGPLWFFYLMCKDGDHETNRFGDDPTSRDVTGLITN